MVAATQNATACGTNLLIALLVTSDWREELVLQACPHACSLPILKQDFDSAVVGLHMAAVSPPWSL